ncbi:alpha-mannosidase [Cohnella sp. GCM10012308]|uniref:alpha-mannosidase n=1 Tax=Cohnella sp. GCM10012308 TaxID=3317329 RepID=UPI00360A1336
MSASIERRLRLLLGEDPGNYWEKTANLQLGYWGERAVGQLFYAYELSKVNGGRYNPEIEAALSVVEDGKAKDGIVGQATALRVEETLQPLSAEAKSYDVLCVSHAHIDMNWMWSWDETVAVTLDTFRTMLALMDEYPQFTFSQSQAAIYRIVEQYAPDMLEEIRRRVREGRWEVTASHWVEADKNMPNGESLTRHLLYTKRYLAKLFGLDPDTLNLDFEPDTFGHSINVPEILASGGVKYYYHCRGNEAPALYRWQSPSGSSIVVYREPTWYNDSIQSVLGAYVPSVCGQTGLKTYLNVYGVGDHGGGPTRRDLERIADMQTWPIYPKLRFGTYGEYFALAETIADRLPVVTGEQNFVFTGCYTSQTRIKTANRVGETALYEAELFNAIAAAEGGAAYPGESLEEAWRGVLFNQFHDILPGSGVLETREHALGLFQNTMASANTDRKLALEKIAASIDTSALAIPGGGDKSSDRSSDRSSNRSSDRSGDTSAGAGAGYGAKSFQVTQIERGGGSTRIVHVFNPSAFEREEAVEILLWDWNTPVKTLAVKDSQGRAVPHQWLDQGRHWYWNHDFMRLLAYVKLPACGYATYTVSEGEAELRPFVPNDPRLDEEQVYVLENERLRVAFNPIDATVTSMLVKSTGEELVDPARPAGLFRWIQEDASKSMTAWWIGRYMKVESVHRDVVIKKGTWGEVRQSLQYEMAFGRSRLKVTVSLDRDSARLVYDVECDWQEVGNAASGIPQLNFLWPFAYRSEAYRYDVPFGVIERPALAHDVPANRFAHAVPAGAGQSSILLATSNKHGFRGTDDSLAVSLIRSSFDPDPYPEQGNHHKFTLALSVVGLDAEANQAKLIEAAARLQHPPTVLSGTAHAGTRPLDGSFLKLAAGAATVSAVKMPEERNSPQRWIVRVYESEGRRADVKLALSREVAEAWWVDAHERRLVPDGEKIAVEGAEVSFELPPYAVRALCVAFA